MRRPPHPVDGQQTESVLRGVDGGGQQRRERARQHARHHAAQQAPRADEDRVRRHREQRPQSQNVAARGRRGHAGQRHRDQAARLPFEQQQLHRQQHRGHRRGEGGGHARRRARHQQRLAFRARQPEELRDHRAERAAGHDDRSFGAERPARADGDGAGERLEYGDLRLHLAAVDQNGFDGFRNAVAADAFRAIARHQADDQRPRDGNQHLPKPQVVARGRDQRGAPALEEEQVGEQADQPQQAPAPRTR